LGSLYDLLKNEVTTMKEAADLVPKLIYFFREKIKEIKEKEDLVEILIPLDIFETIIPYMHYSDDFDKAVPWEQRREGLVGALDEVLFRIYLGTTERGRFSRYIFYVLEDGTKKKFE